MASQTGRDRFDWRRAIIGGVSSGAIAIALMSGFGVSTAFAQPADPAPPGSCTGDDCARQTPHPAAAATAGCAPDAPRSAPPRRLPRKG